MSTEGHPIQQTYEVGVTAYALRTIRIRAGSAAEAYEKAHARIQRMAGPWVIDFPGCSDEHFYVTDSTGKHVGPDPQGEWLDDESTTDPLDTD